MSDTREKIWGEYGGKEYTEVTQSSAKKQLDLDIVELITQECKDSCLNKQTPVIGEFGCGPAPVSSILNKFNEKWGEPLYHTVGFDNSTSMTNEISDRNKVSFQEADISDPLFSSQYLNEGRNPVLDVVVLENSWYAVTTGIGHTDKEEALYRRWAVLFNAWKMLKDNGSVIISDPLSSTKNLDLKNTLVGLKKELSSAISRGELDSSIKNIKNPTTKDVIKRNREEILPKSHLFDIGEMTEFIEKSGLFNIEYLKTGDYMGHNATLVLRKINNPEFRINGTYVLNIQDSIAKPILEDFRKKNYSEKINPIVTGVDGQDMKHDNSLTVISQLVGTYLPGAIATLDIEEDYDDDSWEFASLFNLPSNFLDIIPPNRRTGEIRRLGTIAAYGSEYQILGVESIRKTISRIYEEVYDKKVGILFFTATPDRVKLFNGILRRLGLEEFRKVQGATLNRESDDSLKTIISGSKYFLTEDGYKNLEEDELLFPLRKYLIENKDSDINSGISSLWPGNEEKRKKELLKKLRNIEKFPQNVDLYYVQVPQEKMELSK